MVLCLGMSVYWGGVSPVLGDLITLAKNGPCISIIFNPLMA